MITVVSGDTITVRGHQRNASYATPAGLCSALAAIIELALMTRDETSVILVPHNPLRNWPGNPGREELRNALQLLGYVTQPTEGGWFVCTNGTGMDHRRIILGVREWGAGSQFLDHPDTLGGDAGVILATHLDAWVRRTHEHFVHTPGVAALVSLRAFPRKKQPRWVLKDLATADYWTPPVQIQDHRYRTNRRKGGDVYRWDMRSAYLAAMSSVELPYRQLQHTGMMPHSLTAGYFQIRISKGRYGPTMLWPTPDRQGRIWLSASEYELFRRCSHPFDFLDSWTTQDGGRILRTWAERWRDGITNQETPPKVAQVMKMGYAELVGLMNVQKGTIYRPDWRHMIMGAVRASITRRVLTVQADHGLLPLKINVDAVYYAAKDADDLGGHDKISHSLGVGDRIGNMRFEGLEKL